MDALLQQRAKNARQPIAFSSKKFNPAQQKYSTYDLELRGRKVFPPYAGSAPLYLHRQQTHHLRFPAEVGQVLTPAV
jgi:hypothetical protein